MNLTTLEQEEDILSKVDLPGRGEFVACTSCGHRSYFFYVLGDLSLLPYCYHHGRKHHEKLEEISIHMEDYSDQLKENRLQGAP